MGQFEQMPPKWDGWLVTFSCRAALGVQGGNRRCHGDARNRDLEGWYRNEAL